MARFTPRTTEREMRSAWWDIRERVLGRVGRAIDAAARSFAREAAQLENGGGREAAAERVKVVKTQARAQVNEYEKELHVAISRAALAKSIAAGGLSALKALRTSLSDEQILHEIYPPPSKVWCAWPKPYSLDPPLRSPSVKKP